MGKQREDIRAALELLLTPKQYAYVLSSRGRSRMDWVRILINDGLRYRMADCVARERINQDAMEYIRRTGDDAGLDETVADPGERTGLTPNRYTQ